MAPKNWPSSTKTPTTQREEEPRILHCDHATQQRSLESFCALLSSSFFLSKMASLCHRIQRLRQLDFGCRTGCKISRENKLCAWRHDMPPPLSSPCGRRGASRRRADRRACRRQRSSSFPRSIRSHADRYSCLCVNAAVSKAVW